MTRRTGSRNSGRTSAVRSPQLRRTEPGAEVQHLQRTVGNRATARWLRSQLIQPTLTVSRAGDKYERDADRVADEVMRMPDLQEPASIQRAPLTIQRVCKECDDERQRQSVPDEEEEGVLQAKSAGASEPSGATPGLESYLTTSRSAGEPLPMSARAYFEPRFGHDFSGVRVHTDSRAASAAAAIDARAFTTGADVYFAPGRFHPGTPAGDRLLAHELTHVVQQGGGAIDTSIQPRRIQRQSDEPPGPPEIPDLFGECAAVFGDPQKFVDCCSKPTSGDKVCAQEVVQEICQKPGIRCPDDQKCPSGFKSGGGTFKGLCCQAGGGQSQETCCPPSQIALTKCCPEGTIPNAARNDCIIPPAPPILCPPDRVLPSGKCCLPPNIVVGTLCVFPPLPKPKPKPLPPLPTALEIPFNFNRPSAKSTGTTEFEASLPEPGKKKFRELLTMLTDDPSLKVQLVGRASPEGNVKDNLDLGERRAELIADALEQSGIDRSRIDDPPEQLDEQCRPKPGRAGVASCGKLNATGDGDRQVLARVFAPNP